MTILLCEENCWTNDKANNVGYRLQTALTDCVISRRNGVGANTAGRCLAAVCVRLATLSRGCMRQTGYTVSSGCV